MVRPFRSRSSVATASRSISRMASSSATRSPVSKSSTVSKFKVADLSPGDSRSIVIYDQERNIGKIVRLRYDAKTPRSMTVTLEPCATVKGRLVDQEGRPFQALQVEPQPNPSLSRRWVGGGPLQRFNCGKDGRFEFFDLIPGCDSYSLRCTGPGIRPLLIAEKIVIEPGKTIDLGDITIDHDGKFLALPKPQRGVEKPATPELKAKVSNQENAKRGETVASGAEPSVNEEEPDVYLFRGRVLKPDGQAAAGAKVLALRRFFQARVKWRPRATTVAGPDGRFELRVPKKQADGGGDVGTGSGIMWIAAPADGFGPRWTQWATSAAIRSDRIGSN